MPIKLNQCDCQCHRSVGAVPCVCCIVHIAQYAPASNRSYTQKVFQGKGPGLTSITEHAEDSEPGAA